MSEVIVTNADFAEALASAERDSDGTLIFMPTKTQFTILSGTELYAYNRSVETLPIVGDTFDLHTVDAVYDESQFVSCVSTNKSTLTKYVAVDKIVCPDSLSYMFNGCSKLTSLDLSNFDTSNVVNMYCMFSDCSSLTSLNVSNFDTSKVTNMDFMFNGCSKLTSLDLSNFDTSKVTNMNYMFNGCSKLTSLDLSNFDTSKVTNMNYMFNGCSSLKLDCSSWNVDMVANHVNFNTNASGVTAPTWKS